MTLNCNGSLIDLSRPKVMGILNVTPDSFYDGGKHVQINSIIKQTEKMLNDGATFIDIGGYSSRPGAIDISIEEELRRVESIIVMLKKTFPDIIISIDTFRSTIAKAAVDAGAAIVNDISAGKLDPNMMSVVGKLKVPYIMMHMIGNPQNMATKTTYKNIIKDLNFYFSERIAEARAAKIVDIIIDPGFGFAKTASQSFHILNHFELFQWLELPILAGLSRKSMIYKTLETDSKNALNGTTALHMVALQKGASILRVHDVKEAMECVTLFNELSSN